VRLALLCCIVVLHLVWAGSATGADPYNPQPADGDLILPMPNGVSMVFRPVFVGEGDTPFALKKFLMGDPNTGFKEQPTNVVLGGAFKAERQDKRDWLYYLGKYEVMEDQYYAVMAPQRVSKQEGQLPISNISWFEAQEFIHKYNMWLFENAKDKLPKNDEAVGFVRLPTESEWEFAARGGAEVSREQFEKKIPYTEALNRYEWFSGPTSSHSKLQKAGQLKANILHLHDMLGNVSEMTASYYQIEYYQGRVGGFVARGGNFTTAEPSLRSALRTEQPFYRDLKPQRSPTLGMRLAISAIVFTGLKAAQEIETAWTTYRSSPLGTTSPAPQSIAPPVTVVGVELAEAVAIVERLRQDTTLSQNTLQQLQKLGASFSNIEFARKEAAVDAAFNLFELATIRALYVSRRLQLAQEFWRQLQNSKTEKSRIGNQQDYDFQMKEADEWLSRYIFILRELDKYNDKDHKESLNKSIEKYRNELLRSQNKDMLRAFDVAVRKHLSQYANQKRADVEQWKTDLANL